MTASPADVARRAAVIVQARGLAKGHFEDEQGRVCLARAVGIADEAANGEVGYATWSLTTALWDRLDMVPFRWNDLPATTATDVAKLLLQVADDIEFGGAS